jgi:hypothetical protein
MGAPGMVAVQVTDLMEVNQEDGKVEGTLTFVESASRTCSAASGTEEIMQHGLKRSCSTLHSYESYTQL